MATESRVDVAHAHPFWARPFPDIAVVHNGHITNYYKLRRACEMRGHRFQTENDSEMIAVYIADKLAAGDTLDTALRASIDDLDGTFAYLISTVEGFGLARTSSGPSRWSTPGRRDGRPRLRGDLRSRRPSPIRVGAARTPGERGSLVAQVTSEIATVDAEGQETRDVNRGIDGDRRRCPGDPRAAPRRTALVRGGAQGGWPDDRLRRPVGWYTAGMTSGPTSWCRATADGPSART